MRVAITGATGFIGKYLIEALLKDGATPVVLTRNVQSAQKSLGSGIEAHAWNPESELAPQKVLESVDAVIHLAGEGIANKRWSEKQKKKILDSRVLGTRNLVSALNSLKGKKPKTLLRPSRTAPGSSAVGPSASSRRDETVSSGVSTLRDTKHGFIDICHVCMYVCMQREPVLLDHRDVGHPHLLAELSPSDRVDVLAQIDIE